jgi:NADH:ubiquinone oxidoreductase subunit
MLDSSMLYEKTTMKRADKSYELVTREAKIVVPRALARKAAEWYHIHLLHPGETRTELTIAQHYYWKGMRQDIQKVCRSCTVCLEMKRKGKQYGLLPAKTPEVIPWHTLCIDLIGPYKFGYKDNEVKLHCLTMIDPATGWFEIEEIPTKRADYVVNYLEFTWLTRYPWPTEVVMDRGREFAAEVRDALKDEYGITRKVITTRNPQANAMVERVHQTLGNLIRAAQITGKSDLDEDFGWKGILAACRQAVRSTVHTTTKATPTQLVFGRDAILNVGFEANWQYIKDRKQKLILHNNRRENAKRIPHTYAVGDRVMVKEDPSRKHGSPQYTGPQTVAQVNDNGTVKLSKAARGGVVYQTWNIRNIYPCKD